MLAIELTLPVLLIVGLICFSFITGYWLRSSQIKEYRKKVVGLEKEMLHNHAEILDLQKERAQLLKQFKESSIPVIPLNSKDDTSNDKQRRVK